MVRMVEAEAGSPFCSCISACWSASRAELICATHMRGQPLAAVAHTARLADGEPERTRRWLDCAHTAFCMICGSIPPAWAMAVATLDVPGWWKVPPGLKKPLSEAREPPLDAAPSCSG